MASSEAENKHNNIKKIDDDTNNSGHGSFQDMFSIENTVWSTVYFTLNYEVAVLALFGWYIIDWPKKCLL